MKKGSKLKLQLIVILVLFSSLVTSIVVGALYFQLKETIKYYNDKIVNSSSDITIGMIQTSKEEGEKIILASNARIINMTKERLSEEALKNSEQQNNTLLKVFSGLLNQYMESYESKVGSIVTNPAIYWKKEEASKRILRDIMTRDDAFLGFIVYTETVDPYYSIGEISESNFNYKDMAKTVKEGRSYISPLSSDNSYYVGTKIVNEDGENRGYIVARISLAKISWKIIGNISDSNGKTIFITNSSGKIIRHQNPKYNGANAEVKRDSGLGFKQIVQKNSIYNSYAGEYKGIKYIIYVKENILNSFDYIDNIKKSADITIKKSFNEFDQKLKGEIGKGYNVAKAVSGEKLNDFIQEFIRTIIIVTIAGIIVSLFIGMIIASKLISPLKELSFAVKKIGEGKLDYKIDPKFFRRKDEVGELAVEFYQMKEKLKSDIEKITYLERRKANAERLSMMGQMVSGIVHEIKNPLTSISGFAQIIEEITTDADIKRHTNTIMEETERLNKLARDLLGYAKSQKIENERIRMRALVEGVLEKISPKIRERMVNVKLNIPENIPPIYGDKDRLTQVFINLISNSVESMRGAGGTVEINGKREGDKLSISVIDNGGGIPKEIREKLFMPFVSGKKGGTGLGLAVVRKIIEDHDGDIMLGGVERGTEFIIKLPLKQDHTKE